MKYIMFVRQGQLVPVIFPDFIQHLEVAEALRSHLSLSRSQVVSAGTCEVYCTGTSGQSSTLDVVAQPSDAQTINVYDYCHGIQPATATQVQLVRQATLQALQGGGVVGKAAWPQAVCSGSCGAMGDDPDCPVHGDRMR